MTGNLTVTTISATNSITSPNKIYGAFELSIKLENYLLNLVEL